MKMTKLIRKCLVTGHYDMYTNFGNISYNLLLTNVAGFEKSLHLLAKSEFNFITQDESYTQGLSMDSVSTVQC